MSRSHFAGLGFDENEAEKLSRGVEEASRDFATFNNGSDDVAVAAYASALCDRPDTIDLMTTFLTNWSKE